MVQNFMDKQVILTRILIEVSWDLCEFPKEIG